MARYAEIADLDKFGIAPAGYASMTTDEKNAALDRATAEIDRYLGNVCTLPLTSWPTDLRACCCDLAVFHLLSRRGFEPGTGTDTLIVKRYDDQIRWLEKVSTSQLPPGCVDSTPPTYEGGAYVVTRARRGWGM